MPRRSVHIRQRIALEGVVPFVAFGLLFGLLYNTLFYPHTPVEYLEAATIGVLVGAVVGLAEQQTVISLWLQRRSFLGSTVSRTLAYSLVGGLVLSLVLSIEPAADGECAYPACVLGYIRGPLFVRDLVFTTVFVFLASFAAQIVLLIGTRNFGRLLIGRYHRPREIRAEFMFVDLRGSTGIAETLEHERYSSFLRDFFLDVSNAIHRTRGEVYQYVGDEVVVVWPGGRVGGRWLDCFIAMREAVASRGSTYVDRYGVIPDFKAGVHAGTVEITEVGTLQRAHVYHGDVLNTAARILSMCNELGFDLLASSQAVSSLPPARHDEFEPLGPVVLRGRSGAVELFGYGRARTGST